MSRIVNMLFGDTVYLEVRDSDGMVRRYPVDLDEEGRLRIVRPVDQSDSN